MAKKSIVKNSKQYSLLGEIPQLVSKVENLSSRNWRFGMELSWQDLNQESLEGRDLVEEDDHTSRMWRGPIKEFKIEDGIASFAREWVAISVDGQHWEQSRLVPVGMSTDIASLVGTIDGEIYIAIPGMTWIILPPGDNLPRPN